nr:uncharacterized protein LOC113722877 isoform X1 [Coffea arabica]
MRSGGEVEEQDEQSRVLYELCAMIFHVLQTPPLPISSFPGIVRPAVSSRTFLASPAAFASLFLGISAALMLFGCVTFVFGLCLMPVVIALVMLFHFVGMLYNLSELGRTILWPDCSTTPPVPGDLLGWNLEDVLLRGCFLDSEL